VLDQSQLADPRIGLAQAHSELLRQSHQPLARPVEQFRRKKARSAYFFSGRAGAMKFAKGAINTGE